MHQLNPPMIHKGLHSAAIYLTDDFAAKIADFGFWNVEDVRTGSGDSGLLNNASADHENNVYNLGLILLEIMTGKLPYSEDTGPLVIWASDFLSGARPLKHMMDTTLTSFSENMAMALCQVIRSCPVSSNQILHQSRSRTEANNESSVNVEGSNSDRP